MSTTEENGCEIAVIGMACRFPGAPNLQEFWNRLAEGAELIVPLSDDELLAAGVEPVLLDNPSYVKADGVLAGADLFDAAFFGYTPREAELMDPQLRLFLEIAWEAMETGGYSRDLLSARVGVYAGAGINTYLLSNLYTNPAVIESVGSFQTTILNDRDYLPLHVSYKLNLNGPSVNVQTACSTSLVAVHLACQSLLGRECDLALAGGTSIRVPQGRGYLHEEGGILSPDGHCRAFDEKAAGTISSSGAGAVLLKRLDDAIADRDFVFATIKGTAVNNDGGLKAGFTAPAVEGQAAVIEEALAMAGVRAETVSYVETHGTGTPLGDPIEIAALTEAFRRHTNGKQFCAIGSVKTNLGHLDAAAGMAGLIKTVLALTHRQIPPSLNFERPNPRIDFGNSPFFVNTRLCEWEASGAPRCAGVSSFGIGGTNAHVVLEQAPPRDRGSATKRPNILLVSAMTGNAMESAARNLAGYISAQADVDLSDIAFTLQVGRKGMAHRMAIVCDGRDDAIALLTDLCPEDVFSGYYQKGNRPVVFVFPGQGVQYPGMGSGLYQVENVFTEEVDRCLGLIDSTAASSLRALLLPNGSLKEKSDILLQDTALAQPALFVISYALARQLMHWGIGPDAMIGHSIGEYVAACLAGVMELDDAIRIVLLRGKLLSKLPQGAMLAVPQNEAEARRTLEGMPGLSVAAVNGPKLTIISGRADSIERLETSLSMAGVSSKRLRVSHAFHSEMMTPVLSEFAGAVAKVRLHPPQVPYASNVTGTFITAEQATNPGYYARHLRETVRFYQGISGLMSEPDRVLLEVGPSGVLQGIAGSRVNGVERAPIIQTLRRPTDRSADATALAGSLARLWACGVDVNWDAFHDGEARNRVPLPTYPFERQRYWIDASENRPGGEHPKAKQEDISKWFYRRSWKRSPLPRRPADSGPSVGAARPRFLLFADEFGISDRLAPLCRDESIDCVVVRPGERFERAGDGGYVMNPADRESYTKLLKDLRANQRLPDLIFHCWNESLISSISQTATTEPTELLGYSSMVYLSQAIGELAEPHAVEILAITNQALDVIGIETLNPAAAAIQGPCKVIPLEFPHVICRSVDILVSGVSDPSIEPVADNLRAEARSTSTDRMVAYRNGLRWIAGVDPVAVDPENLAPPLIRGDGAYLITGGLGEIEFELARHLADLGARQLVVVGLPSLPAGASWADFNHAPIEDSFQPIAGRLNELADLGLDILADSSEAADFEAMKMVLARATQRFTRINGVVHTAFATEGGMIQLKSPESIARVMAPKISGTNALDTLLKDQPLDFFILFSSTLALTGVFGQCDYCAANAYVDAFAGSRRARTGANVVAIAWDVTSWELWQEDAMIAAPELQAQIREVRVRYGITASEAMRCLDIALALESPQVIVSARDFMDFLAAQQAAQDGGFLNQIASIGRQAPGRDRESLSSDYVPPTGEIEIEIAGIWQDLFGIGQIGANDDFFGLGGNSLVAIQAISRLRKEFDVDLPMSALFEHPTVATLSAAILEARSQGDDMLEMEQLLAEIEDLTPEQVRAALAEEQPESGK